MSIENNFSYSVDTNLFDYINSNQNLTESQKSRLYDMLNIIKFIYDKYVGDYNFDNVAELIKTVKITEKGEDSEILYDKDNNELVLGKSQNNKEYNTYKCLIELTSQRFDRKTNSYLTGVIVKSEDGHEYGKKLNDLIISKLITYNTGYSLASESIFENDELLKNITDTIGSEKLVAYFTNANGKQLFTELFNKEKKGKKI